MTAKAPCLKCGEHCVSQDEFIESNGGQRWPYCSGCDPQLHEPYVGRIGEIWEDEDLRHMGRVGRVIGCNDTHAWLRWSTGNTTRVRLDRLAPPKYFRRQV